MVAKKKNMEGGIPGLYPSYNKKNIEDIFLKLKERNSILNKLRVEQRLEAFLKKMAEELHRNSEHFDKFYHMFIHICEKYPSEIRKIQEKEQITLDLRNKNMYLYEPFYYIRRFFLDKFKNNNNRRKKIIDIHNINNNNRRMNDLISRIGNKKNTSFKNQVKTFFSWSKSGEFLNILERKLDTLLLLSSFQNLNEKNIEKIFNQLLRITKRILQFENKIKEKDENLKKKLNERLENILNTKYTEVIANFSTKIYNLLDININIETLGLYKYMQIMLIQLLEYSSYPYRNQYLNLMNQTKNRIDSFISEKEVNKQKEIQNLWLEKVKMAQQEILGEPSMTNQEFLNSLGNDLKKLIGNIYNRKLQNQNKQRVFQQQNQKPQRMTNQPYPNSKVVLQQGYPKPQVVTNQPY